MPKQNHTDAVAANSYDAYPGFLFALSTGGFVTQMNTAFRRRLGLNDANLEHCQINDLLTVGSKIFFQTHFFPLLRIQHSASEIYVKFQSPHGDIPVLLNAVTEPGQQHGMIYCAGLEISNRDKFEQEIMQARNAAEQALFENKELSEARHQLEANQKLLEAQFRDMENLFRKHQEIFKVITHDLQEPLRKSVMFADIVLSRNPDLEPNVKEKLLRIIKANERMRHVLLTIQRYEELDNRHLRYSEVSLLDTINEAVRAADLQDQPYDLSTAITKGHFAADATLIYNLFVELFINSIKSRKPDQTLEIEITAVQVKKNIFEKSREQYNYQDFIRITYADNGFGVKSNKGAFNIIKQSEDLDDVGLGLAFCKKIVEKHLGSISVASNEQESINFTIFLPVGQQ